MSHSNSISMRELEQKYPFFKLIRPVGGVVEEPMPLFQGEMGIPEFKIYSSGLGNLTMTAPHVRSSNGGMVTPGAIGGAGSDEYRELALVRSVAEAAERYANSMLNESSSWIVASQNELGDEAMDLSTLPVCSERELADPNAMIGKADPDAPIRWVKSYSLTEDREVYVPAILTHLFVQGSEHENFVYPISTGVAAHSDLIKAVTSAICEVVERDAIALTWLAKLPLPQVEFDLPVQDAHKDKFRQLARGHMKQLFFDATTDIGIPTIYSVQLVDGHPTLSQFVSCSTNFDAAEAAAKVIRESASGRTMFEQNHEIPANVSDFMRLEDGAAFMGRPENRSYFDFLLNSPTRRPISAIKSDYPEDDAGRLHWLKQRFSDLGYKVYISELTTDELRDVGLRTVRVIIPGLMPMTPVQRARFLGHPRLYQYPQKAGFGPFTEDMVNPAPQPFA